MSSEEVQDEVTRKCLEALRKHFDAVAIFTTKQLIGPDIKEYLDDHPEEKENVDEDEESITLSYRKLSGNYNTIYGMVKRWVNNNE